MPSTLTLLWLLPVSSPAHAAEGGIPGTPAWLYAQLPEAAEATLDVPLRTGLVEDLKGTLPWTSPLGETAVLDVDHLTEGAVSSHREELEKAASDGATDQELKTSDTFTEFEDRYVFVFRSETSVSDPEKFAQHVSGYSSSAADLDACEQLDFDAIVTSAEWKDGLDPYLAHQPSALQAWQNNDAKALCQSVYDGKGLYAVTTTVSLIKPEVLSEKTEVPTGAAIVLQRDQSGEMPALAATPETVTAGKVTGSTAIAFGYVYALEKEVEERIEVAGSFAWGAGGMVARMGLRFPYQLDATLRPETIVGPGDEWAGLSHELVPLDGDANLYESMGLEGWSGQEASLGARVWACAKVRGPDPGALFFRNKDYLHIRCPDARDRMQGGDLYWDLVNEGIDFQAPLGAQTVSKSVVFEGADTGLAVDLGLVSAGVDLALTLEGAGRSVRHSIGGYNLELSAHETSTMAHTQPENLQVTSFTQRSSGSDVATYGALLTPKDLNLSAALGVGIRLAAVIHLDVPGIGKPELKTPWASARIIGFGWTVPPLTSDTYAPTPSGTRYSFESVDDIEF